MEGAGGVKGDSVIGHDIILNSHRDIQDLIREQGKSMPISVLVDIGR